MFFWNFDHAFLFPNIILTKKIDVKNVIEILILSLFMGINKKGLGINETKCWIFSVYSYDKPAEK